MIGIIPAAGKGTRLGLPYPKELVPVTHEGSRVVTVIESNIQQLAHAGIDQAVIVISREKQVIKDYLGDEYCGVELRYVYQNRMHSREGLTDAVMSAQTLAYTADACLMLMGDVYFTDNEVANQLIARLGEVPAAIAAVSVWETHEPHRFGIVQLSGDSIVGVVDKPEGMEVGYHWGAVAFRPDFWFYMNYELHTFSAALHRAVKDKVIYTPAGGRYLDMGTPRALIEGIVEVNT